MDMAICTRCSEPLCRFHEEDAAHYSVCMKCGRVWYLPNGPLTVKHKDMVVFDNTDDLPRSVCMSLVDTALHTSMEDFVHKCFKCNGLAYEIEAGLYKCLDTTCNFEWEVYGNE